MKVRVTNKTDIRTWSNAKGDGKLFSMDMMDETGEIRGTAFNAECDKFYHMIEVVFYQHAQMSSWINFSIVVVGQSLLHFTGNIKNSEQAVHEYQKRLRNDVYSIYYGK